MEMPSDFLNSHSVLDPNICLAQRPHLHLGSFSWKIVDQDLEHGPVGPLSKLPWDLECISKHLCISAHIFGPGYTPCLGSSGLQHSLAGGVTDMIHRIMVKLPWSFLPFLAGEQRAVRGMLGRYLMLVSEMQIFANWLSHFSRTSQPTMRGIK